jgi:tetratricopeptide (TPR) repeat protein
MIDRMITVTHDAGLTELEGMAWGFRSFALFFEHDLERAHEAGLKAAEISPDNADARFMSLFTRAAYHMFTTDFVTSRAMWDEMRRLAPDVQHPWIRGLWGWESPAFSHWDGDYHAALEQYAAVQSYREASGDVTHAIWGKWVAAMATAHAGDYEEGLRLFNEVVVDSERVGDLLILFRTLNSVGWVYGELQDIESAMEWNRRGLEAALAAGFPDPEVECNAALNLGDNFMAAGRPEEAEEQYRFVEKIYRDPRPQDRFMLWRYAQHMLHSYGTLWLARGEVAKARQFARECLALAEPSVSRKNIVKGRRLLAQIELAEGDVSAAEAECRIALDIAREVGNPGQLWKTLETLGDVLAAAGRDDEAANGYREAVEVVDAVAARLTNADLRSTFLLSAEVMRIRAKIA